MNGLIHLTDKEIIALHKEMNLAMSLDDLVYCRDYFKRENREPTVTELRVIDTYWSDHCRHTTFTTTLDEIIFEEGVYKNLYKKAFALYMAERDNTRPVTLMDMATAAMKRLKKRGLLTDLDESDEINACSIFINVDADAKNEEWILQFKNETHNHPTEINPYAGAATCLGGAIRDPLAGRAYVYQAMRVTGSGEPRQARTLPGKLPQQTITTQAAAGYSDYGNQLGVAAGHVAEIYHEGYTAKRLELGAVIGAVKREHVRREPPADGDVVLLIGGRTGRDGCGGAAGSSKGQETRDETDVPEGNPVIGRGLLRLYKKPEAIRLIKRCNDFGAGGISVAVGELADGLDIDLDAVPVMYDGLDGTELAISESQERMAVVTAAADADTFRALAAEENLECTPIARVTDSGRMVMRWRGKTIVNMARSFLSSSGAARRAQVKINSAKEPAREMKKYTAADWLPHLRKINNAGQVGLAGHFDATAGAGTVLMPYGGKHRLTPSQAMAAKIPVNGETETISLMAFGFDPYESEISPFHGAVKAVTESLAKVVAVGGSYKNARLSFQEYFERLGGDPTRWQKPFLALLGAFWAQMAFETPAIGGKDSMSGSYEDGNTRYDVPPALVSFCVQTAAVNDIISQEFKSAGHTLVWLRALYDENDLPDFTYLKESFTRLTELIKSKRVAAAYALDASGLCTALTKMALGNGSGATVEGADWFTAETGSFLLEMSAKPEDVLAGLRYEIIGKTTDEPALIVDGMPITLLQCHDAWLSTLEPVFPTGRFEPSETAPVIPPYTVKQKTASGFKHAKPRVFIPVFPGTNGEYSAARAFAKAGALTDEWTVTSLHEMEKRVRSSQILMLANGCKDMSVLREPRILEAIHDLLRRDGLVLGIGDGFHALISAGLLACGDIKITQNAIGRFVSDLVMTKIISNLSPWLWNTRPDDVFLIPYSHGEGRLMAADIKPLTALGQIAAQYVDFDGNPSMDIRFNPSGSFCAVEALTNADGRILGKMGHSDRIGEGLYKGFDMPMEQGIFAAGVSYYK
jgi:phosphoribosylformylglycinamidine synthase